MHMYPVIQTSPLRTVTVVALHGTLGEATIQAVRLDRDQSGFRYHVDAEPVEVTYMPINREDTK